MLTTHYGALFVLTDPLNKLHDGEITAPLSYQYAYELWCDPELMNQSIAKTILLYSTL